MTLGYPRRSLCYSLRTQAISLTQDQKRLVILAGYYVGLCSYRVILHKKVYGPTFYVSKSITGNELLDDQRLFMHERYLDGRSSPREPPDLRHACDDGCVTGL